MASMLEVAPTTLEAELQPMAMELLAVQMVVLAASVTKKVILHVNVLRSLLVPVVASIAAKTATARLTVLTQGF
jgi:hypothetical protein